MPRGAFEEGPRALEVLRTAGFARASEITDVPEGGRITRVTEVPEVPGVPRVQGVAGTTHDAAVTHRIDGLKITTSAEAMAAIAEALSFPEYFGHNLDALYDCLTDLAWLPPGEHLLVWTRSSVLRNADPAAYEAIRAVLVDAVTDDTPGEAFLSVLLPAD